MSLQRRRARLEAEMEMAHEGPPLEERLCQTLEKARARRQQGQLPVVEHPDPNTPLGGCLQAALERARACREISGR
jgi:hypothetical protein